MSNDPDKKHHRVVFVKRNNGCFMVPGHIVAGDGDKIFFSAAKEITTVQMYFPVISIFKSWTEKAVELDNSNPSNKNKVVVEIASGGDGVYPFVAYCTDSGGGSFAIGGSDPEIIIQT